MTREDNSLITKIFAQEIKDSRENPTIKVTVFAGGVSDSFSVPSGASAGVHEAHVIENSKAILNVNGVIAKALIGQNILNQKDRTRAGITAPPQGLFLKKVRY